MTTNIDLECSINDAMWASTALALALQGLDKIAINDDDQKLAIEWLAAEARFAAEKARTTFYALTETNVKHLRRHDGGAS